ncbi:4-hydroxythreonine-4-phosphate dehydrogenase PdxA [Candidatus Pelagibacter sp.]|nr:4-hydroxythreonine-4-phosphate dehydrogenase PdxA [Candidatus Pelagibacter sp.]
MSPKDYILLVAGEPNSIFLEIFLKTIDEVKVKKPLILISSLKVIQLQMKKLNYKKKIKLISSDLKLNNKLDNKSINLININYDVTKGFESISSKSNKYIESCFQLAFKVIKTNKIKRFISGPINKNTFLNKKYLGMTEYISKNFKIKKNAMLIYNRKLSVCPLTTHLPLKLVSRKISKKLIIEKVELINQFYKKLNIKPKIAVLGLNPHCESVSKFNEDLKIIKPTIKILKRKRYNIHGPFPADTMFLKNNRDNFDVILGMYHDQVLTPVKTIFEYDAINITLGLPFMRISPDHGPNEKMMGKNMSNPLSLIKAISFLDKY